MRGGCKPLFAASFGLFFQLAQCGRVAYALVVEPRLNLVLLPPFLGLFLGAALLACALVVLLAPLFQLGAGGFYVLVTLYQAIHRGRRSRPISWASSVLFMRSMRWRSACASRSCCWARSRLAA